MIPKSYVLRISEDGYAFCIPARNYFGQLNTNYMKYTFSYFFLAVKKDNSEIYLYLLFLKKKS